jgi:Transcriptional regulator, AbiEi antitoxin
MRPQSRTVERRIALIADRQHGVVTRRALLDAGLSVEEIKRRVRKGLLLPEFPGVYRVGHGAPSVDARYMAAVLACGAGARLSGRAAAHLHRLIKGAAPRPEVTAPTERKVSGIKTRRSRNSDPRDLMKVRGIPVTTVAAFRTYTWKDVEEDPTRMLKELTELLGG